MFRPAAFDSPYGFLNHDGDAVARRSERSAQAAALRKMAAYWTLDPDAEIDTEPSVSVFRRAFLAVRDFSLIASGWALLIGVIAYPEAQLVGVGACAAVLAAGSLSRGAR